MNAYAVVVLIALCAEYALSCAADLCNLRALRSAPPPGLEDVYDAERYRRSQEYTRASTRFGLVRATFDLALLLAFWAAGGFGWLDRATAELGWGAIPTGLAYVGALAGAGFLVALPFRWWSTFVIEERFGFNRTTPRTFALDTVKGAALAAVLGGALLAAVIAIFERFGPGAWLAGWAVLALATVALQLVAPTWILPLFLRFRPIGAEERERDLRERILAYARSVGFPLAGLYVVDGSRRSTKANAFFTGFGRTKRVALYDTLIERHPPDELVAVVAHEIGHYKKNHVVLGTLLSIAHSGLLLLLLSFFLRERALFEAFGVAKPSVHAGLVFFGLLYTPVELALQVALSAWSRRNEYAADRFSAETTGLARELADGLKRLSAESLSNLTPHPLYVLLHHSHPPLKERVAALERFAAASAGPRAS